MMYDEHPYQKFCQRMDDVCVRFNTQYIKNYRFSASWERIEKGDMGVAGPFRAIVRLPAAGTTSENVRVKIRDKNMVSVEDLNGTRIIGVKIDDEFEEFKGFRVRDGVIELLFKYALPKSWNTQTWAAYSDKLWEEETKND